MIDPQTVFTAREVAKAVPDDAGPWTMPIYTIYNNPSDYPGKVVVRCFTIGRGLGEPLKADAPSYVGDSLAAARAWINAMAPDMVCVPRSPDDEYQIVECWL